MSDRQEAIFLGVGNPILDIVCNDVSEETVDQFGLKMGEGILAEKRHIPMYDDLEKRYSCIHLPGGCSQNTSRILQALLTRHGSVIYTGCIGNDENGKLMRNLAKNEGLETKYDVSVNAATGRCAVLVRNRERAMCTELGAANDYTLSFFNSHWETFKNVKAMYTSGFFLTVCKEVMHKMALWCVENDKYYCFNLSTFFLIDQFKEDMKILLSRSSIVFGNRDEFSYFGEVHNLDVKSIHDIAKKVIELMDIRSGDFKDTRQFKYVCITQGKDPVIIAERSSKTPVVVHEIPVIPVPDEDIVDLNGAGDAFVGGFLYGILSEKSLEKCVAWGHYAASNVIKRSGFSFDFSDRPLTL